MELDPRGEQGLAVDEVDEAALLVQVRDEGERRVRVAHRREVLEEGDLHRRPGQEHPAVPAEARLALDELRGHGPLGSGRVACAPRSRCRARGRTGRSRCPRRRRRAGRRRRWASMPVLCNRTSSRSCGVAPLGCCCASGTLARRGAAVPTAGRRVGVRLTEGRPNARVSPCARRTDSGLTLMPQIRRFARSDCERGHVSGLFAARTLARVRLVTRGITGVWRPSLDAPADAPRRRRARPPTDFRQGCGG